MANGGPIEVYIQERWPWAISSLSSPSSPATTKTGWIPVLESNLIQREMVIVSVLVASFVLLNCTFSAFRSANLPQGFSSLAPEGNWARRPSSPCWLVVALSNPRYNSGLQQPVLEKVKNNIYPRDNQGIGMRYFIPYTMAGLTYHLKDSQEIISALRLVICGSFGINRYKKENKGRKRVVVVFFLCMIYHSL